MELIECSETSAYCSFNQTPGKYPKEYIHLDPKHGESLKSRKKEELKKERRKLLLVANQIEKNRLRNIFCQIFYKICEIKFTATCVSNCFEVQTNHFN